VHRSAGWQRLPRRIAAAAVVALMIGALSTTAQAAGPDEISTRERAARAGVITADLLLIRPAGVIMSIFGVALFLPTVVLSSPGGWDNVTRAYELLIQEPFRTTFQRPLGEA
jgi:hypothetical protein